MNSDDACLLITETKAHRDRIQPLCDEDVAALRELQASTLKDSWPFATMIEKGMPKQGNAIVKTAGIATCTVHDLRRTFCTDLARLGVNQLVVQRLAGHSCAATTANYYTHINDATKRDAVARLSGTTG